MQSTLIDEGMLEPLFQQSLLGEERERGKKERMKEGKRELWRKRMTVYFVNRQRGVCGEGMNRKREEEGERERETGKERGRLVHLLGRVLLLCFSLSLVMYGHEHACLSLCLQERDKFYMSRIVVLELLQALKFKSPLPDTNVLLLVQVRTHRPQHSSAYTEIL